MKKLTFVALACLLALTVGFTAVHAQSEKLADARFYWQEYLGWTHIDTALWSDNTDSSKVCSLVGGLWDTTISDLEIGGVEILNVVFEMHSRNNEYNVTIYAHVSPDRDTWIPLTTSYSVNNTAGAEVGGSAGSFRDTILYVLADPAQLQDSLATAGGHETHLNAPKSEMVMTRGMRWLRFVVKDGTTSGDTTTMKAIVTRKWPAFP